MVFEIAKNLYRPYYYRIELRNGKYLKGRGCKQDGKFLYIPCEEIPLEEIKEIVILDSDSADCVYKFSPSK